MPSTNDRRTAAAKAIEDIEVGDQVWSRNEYTGEEGFKPVVRLFRNEARELVHLSYRRESGQANRGTGAGSASDRKASKGGESDDEDDPASRAGPSTITGTTEHPFWSLTRGGWVPMGEVGPGERLLLADGGTATVTATCTERLTQPVTVYNFEVADWHTYHVGAADAGWVWVHNICARGAVNKLKGMRLEARTKGTALNKLVSGQRRTAVKEAWKAEKALLKAGEQGTVKWTGSQRLQLRVLGKVRGFQGHHINSVAGSPYMASWKSNVTFMNRANHLAAHGGNWRTRTYGRLHELYGGSLR